MIRRMCDPRAEILEWVAEKGIESIKLSRLNNGVRPRLIYRVPNTTEAVHAVLSELEAEGLVEISYVRTGQVGRPATVIRFKKKRP